MNSFVMLSKKIKKLTRSYSALRRIIFFMSDSEFHKEVTNSALSPSKRKYKNYKIKVTQDEYQIDLKFQEK